MLAQKRQFLLQAARIVVDSEIATPILVGRPDVIEARAEALIAIAAPDFRESLASDWQTRSRKLWR